MFPLTRYRRSYWKLNSQLLNDYNYTEHIKQVIKNTKTEMSGYLNKRQLWDFCELKIKETSIDMKKEEK